MREEQRSNASAKGSRGKKRSKREIEKMLKRQEETRRKGFEK